MLFYTGSSSLPSTVLTRLVYFCNLAVLLFLKSARETIAVTRTNLVDCIKIKKKDLQLCL